MEISRRGFVGSLIGGIAAAAAVRSFPFRVYSFPKEIAPLAWNVPRGAFIGIDWAYGPGFETAVEYVNVYRSPAAGGPYTLVQEISVAEAKRLYGISFVSPERRIEFPPGPGSSPRLSRFRGLIPLRAPG